MRVGAPAAISNHLHLLCTSIGSDRDSVITIRLRFVTRLIQSCACQPGDAICSDKHPAHRSVCHNQPSSDHIHHHLQLYGLLCSLVKLDGSENSLGSVILDEHDLPLGAELCPRILSSIAAVLEAALWAATAAAGAAETEGSSQGPVSREQSQSQPVGPKDPQQQGSISSSCSGSSISGGHNSAQTTVVSSAAVDLAALSPWPWLLGRCFLELAATVHKGCVATGCTEEAASLATGNPSEGFTEYAYAHEMLLTMCCSEGRLCTVIFMLYAWLSKSSTARQMSAAGGNMPALLESLRALRETARAYVVCRHAMSCFTFARQLREAGTALCCFAHPYACNNPPCGNVAGPSEAQLVGGRSCICAGCKTPRYCGKACQRQHWKQHKPVCQALAAAAAVAE